MNPWSYGPGTSPWNQWGPSRGGAPGQSTYLPKVNGAWVGTGGEALLLKGNRFRLSDGQGGEMGGTVRYLPNAYLELQPTWGTPSRYEYGVMGDVLALRDSSGQVLMFRRAQRNGW